MKQTFHFAKRNAVQSLAKSPHEFAQLLQRGMLSVEIYQPAGVDRQDRIRKTSFMLLSPAGVLFSMKAIHSK